MAQDYIEKFLPKLAGQFENSPKLKAMVSAMLSFFSELETEADRLKTERWIDSAIGQQLDGCGYIVGELRKGRSDDEYREAIKFRVFVNVSGATPDDLIKALKFLTNPTDCQYLEAYPATAILFTNGYFVSSDIHRQIQELSPAGISDVPVLVSYADKPFRFGKAPIPAELFVNDDYLSVNGSDLQVSTSASFVDPNTSTLGGLIGSDLGVNSSFLEVNGMILAVHNPNTSLPFGEHKLTGVYQ